MVGGSFTRRRLERAGYEPPRVTPLDARWLRRPPFEWCWQVPVRVVAFELQGDPVGVYVTRLRVGNEDQLAAPGPVPLEFLMANSQTDCPLVLPSQRPGIMIAIELWGEKLQGKGFAIRPAGVVAGAFQPGPTP